VHLKPFLQGLATDERAEFLQELAARAGTTVGAILNVAYGSRRASAALAMQAELLSSGRITRADLRPADAHRIWADMPAANADVVGIHEVMQEAAA
jgi:hypothetical protein